MSQQTWNPDDYARHAGFVAELGSDLLGLLDARAGENILDLGCGDGALTAKLLASGCRVTGIDSSAEQVLAARARGIDARVGDGEALDFDAAFDGVISNAALHWMKRPAAVLAGVWRALRPGGRFVGEMGGAGNVGAVVDAAGALLAARGIDAAAWNPWTFPAVDEYSALLKERGFTVEFITLFARPTPQNGDIVHWLRLFIQSFAAAIPAVERDDFYHDLAARLRGKLQHADGRWFVDYMRLRFKAQRPA